MKINSDPDHDDTLLDAVLRDDGWAAANAADKAKALGIFHARQRLRRGTRWASGLTVLALAGAFALHWLAEPAAPPRRLLALKTPESRPGAQLYLTDDELIALFPKGSCFLAEVDGKKKLVFLDPKVERQYISEAGEPPAH